MAKQYVNSEGVISDIRVRSDRLNSLVQMDSFLTPDEKSELFEISDKLKKLTTRAIRRLHDDFDHPYPMIGEAINASTNAVLELANLDPMTFKPR